MAVKQLTSVRLEILLLLVSINGLMRFRSKKNQDLTPMKLFYTSKQS